jgi:hypothetical protein
MAMIRPNSSSIRYNELFGIETNPMVETLRPSSNTRVIQVTSMIKNSFQDLPYNWCIIKAMINVKIPVIGRAFKINSLGGSFAAISAAIVVTGEKTSIDIIPNGMNIISYSKLYISQDLIDMDSNNFT